jgi:hypothetical protein
MAITAKYPGKCSECGGAVKAGERIEWDKKAEKGKAVRHTRCAAAKTPEVNRPKTFAPTGEQLHALELFATGKNLAIEAGAGTGKTSTLILLAESTPKRGQYVAFNKALRYDQPVATPLGWTEIGLLKIGDQVFGSDGYAHRVTKVIDRGVRPMNIVAFSDGTKVVADDEHLWQIERTDTGNSPYVHESICTTDEIRQHLAARRSVRIPQQSPLVTSEHILPIDPWLLGALLGDGSMMNGRIGLTSADEWIIDEVTRLAWAHSMCFVKTVGSTHLRTARTVAIVGGKIAGSRRHNPLMVDLRALGVYGRAADSKFVPPVYLWASKEHRLAMLQGLMDTDGCAGAASVTPIFTTTSSQLADDVAFLARSLGGAASKRLMKAATDKWAASYQVTVRLPRPWIPFRLPVKVSALRLRSHDRLLRRRIVNITPTNPAKAFCIAIDSADHLFLTAGLVPTHNSIVTEAGAKMPGTVNCSTAHSLAFRAVGHQYRERLSHSRRMRSLDIALHLGIEAINVTTGENTKTLGAPFLGGLVMQAVTRFCQSADMEPQENHVPYIEGIDEATERGRGYSNNNYVRRYVLPFVKSALADIIKPNGILPFRHDHYLKIWHLSGPRISADYIMFDEAQDANSVLLAIVEAQTHAQRVYVGDSQQAIYGFTGASNALDRIREQGAETAYLTQSFRFGDAVAAEANRILEMIPDAALRLVGTEAIASVVGPVAEPNAILTRTNATAVRTVMRLQASGKIAALVGGGDEVVSFAKAADDLMNGNKTEHHDLACFADWDEVKAYVNDDEQGGDLRLMVRLVDDFGVAAILAALGRTIREDEADVTVSTAHKSKGREWMAVQLAGDFLPVAKMGTDELRLLYVSVTRAKRDLDITAIDFGDGAEEQEGAEVKA